VQRFPEFRIAARDDSSQGSSASPVSVGIRQYSEAEARQDAEACSALFFSSADFGFRGE
jgi:hypothetical protein